MNSKKAKKFRKEARRYFNRILSNMTFWERVKFILFGEYINPLKRIDGNLRDGKYYEQLPYKKMGRRT